MKHFPRQFKKHSVKDDEMSAKEPKKEITLDYQLYEKELQQKFIEGQESFKNKMLKAIEDETQAEYLFQDCSTHEEEKILQKILEYHRKCPKVSTRRLVKNGLKI